MKPIYFEPAPEAPECPQETRPPLVGWRLNAGLKTLLRATLSASASILAWWGTDPSSFQIVAAFVPARYVWLFAALTVAAGFAHNHFNNRKPQ